MFRIIITALVISIFCFCPQAKALDYYQADGVNGPDLLILNNENLQQIDLSGGPNTNTELFTLDVSEDQVTIHEDGCYLLGYSIEIYKSHNGFVSAYAGVVLERPTLPDQWIIEDEAFLDNSATNYTFGSSRIACFNAGSKIYLAATKKGISSNTYYARRSPILYLIKLDSILPAV